MRDAKSLLFDVEAPKSHPWQSSRKSRARPPWATFLPALRRLDIARLYIPLLFVLSSGMLFSVFVGHYLALVKMNSVMELKNVNILGPRARLPANPSATTLTSVANVITGVLPGTSFPSHPAIRDWASSSGSEPPLGKPGISIVAACRNRHDTFAKSFVTFLAADKVDEIIIVDWSSSPPLRNVVMQHNDSRVRYFEVRDEGNWVLSRAYNLGVSLARYETVLRLDCDHAIDPRFVDAHPLDGFDRPVFYSGNWQVARNTNEVHLNGAMVIYRSMFWRVLGYDERIQTYGWDDEDIFARLENQGYVRRPLNYDMIIHLLHPESARGQKGVEFAAVETDVNRILLAKLEAWGPQTGGKEASDYRVDADQGHAIVRLQHRPRPVSEFFSFDERQKAWEEALGRRLHDDFGVVWDLLTRLDVDMKRRLLREFLVKSKELKTKPKLLIAHVAHGLGNRIRALGSAMAFAKSTNRILAVIWESDEHCNARFNDLFKNDIVFTEKTLKWPFSENYKWDAAWKGVLGFNYMEAEGNGAIKDAPIEDIPNMHIFYKGAYIMNSPEHSSWERDNEQIALLQPVDEVSKMVNDHLNEGLSHRIGVHIRNMGLVEEVAAIDPTKEYGSEAAETMNYWRRKSGYLNFVAEMDRLIREDPKAQFYIASDTHTVLEKLRERYPGKIVTQERDCDGRESGCLRFALVDMLCLARTKLLLGSNWSSFTEAVQRLGAKNTLLAGIDFAKDDATG